jgi:hypothetical protein
MTINDIQVTYTDANGEPTTPTNPVSKLLRAWLSAYVGMYETYYVRTDTADGSAQLRWAPTV